MGESQELYVKEYEIPTIQAAFRQIHQDYNPMFLQCLVVKRISDRAFLLKPDSQYVNPSQGVVISQDIVSESGKYFLLFHTSCRNGSSVPTLYKILHNDTDLSYETFYNLTNILGFDYAIYQGAIKIPNVVQCAHKIAYLYGSNFDTKANDAPHLEDSKLRLVPFYI